MKDCPLSARIRKGEKRCCARRMVVGVRGFLIGHWERLGRKKMIAVTVFQTTDDMTGRFI